MDEKPLLGMQKVIKTESFDDFSIMLDGYLMAGWKIVANTFVVNEKGCLCVIEKEDKK